MDESYQWLALLAEVAVQNRAEDALLFHQAMLAAVAPGSLKGGDRIAKEIVRALKQAAGL